MTKETVPAINGRLKGRRLSDFLEDVENYPVKTVSHEDPRLA
jgi:hypothetical protein